MVSKESITQVFNEILNNTINKCWTKDQIREKLSSLSYNDQFQQLQEQGLLNPLEEKDYNKKQERLKTLDDYFEEHGTDDLFGAEVSMYEERERLVDDLFYYGRRLIEGLTYKPIPNIDKSKFKQEEQWGGENQHNLEWSSKQGILESKQISAQQKAVKVDNSLEMFTDEYGIEYGRYKDMRLLAMDNYFDGDTQHINSTISHEGYLKALDKEQRKQVKDIDSLMNDSPGLQQDTILYRGGHFDIHLKPGDNIKFKGYQSTTFHKATSDVYKEDYGGYGDTNMTYVIHAPKGTKGIVGNDSRFTNNNWEHEYVLPRNTSMTILSIDYDTMTCEVVIDG